jgi:uncharacterized coiled-coil protein SlyX
MANTSFSDTLASAQLITAGLRSHLDKLSKRGMDEAFVTDFEGSMKKVHELNAEQEGLKARLKEKTAELETELAGLKDKIAESKKVIKLGLDQPTWKQFGIS